MFGAIAIVFAVSGVNAGIFSGIGSLEAMSAGWLILSMVNIIWVLYFTSEEDSLALYVFNSFGTGGLTPPSRRRRTRTTGSVHNMSANNGYAANYSPGAGIGSHDVAYGSVKGGSGLGVGSAPAAHSQNSFGGGGSVEGGNRSIGAAGSNRDIASNPTGGPGSIGGGDTNGPNSPLMGLGSSDMPNAEIYSYKAKALYACTSLLFLWPCSTHPSIRYCFP